MSPAQHPERLLRTPSWTGVVLVCKQCAKRSSGPKRLETKALVTTARNALSGSKPRPRVMTVGCLGLCPKGAIAVASVGPQGSRLVAVETKRALRSVLPALVGRASMPG